MKAPEKVPYQKGFGLTDEDYQLIEPDVEWEYHSQYLTQNSYKISGDEGEPEPVITPPPPTAPELEDPLLFDPKVTGIGDHLIALMTDERKAQLKESAKSEQVTPSFRHVDPTPREASPSSEGSKSRGPSRKNPLYLGRIALAAHKARTFVQFQDVENTILPCDEREAVALFSSPPWIQRVTACTTSDEIIEVFRLYHQQCWSEEHKNTTDLLMQTEQGVTRYRKIRRRLKYMDVYAAQQQHYPTEFEEDDAFTSEDEPLILTAEPVVPKYRHVIPGDFILIFHILALASSLEQQFPHRAEYWWTLLPGTLDQACMCFSMQRWVDELKTCKDEESFLTTYQSFLNTTWEAVANRVPSSGTFPFIHPTPQELSVAYYMKNRALILHNRMVWGPEADEKNPKPPSKKQESESKPSQEGETAGDDLIDTSIPPLRGDGDDEDPNRKKPDDTSQSKGDESQDPEKKEEEKEASADQPQSSAEKEAQDKINELMQKLQEARDAKAKAEREAQEAAEERARKAGEDLVYEINTEQADKQRKREAAKEKKAKRKRKKNAPENKGESEPSEGEEDNPEGDKSQEKKSEQDESSKDESKEEDKDKEGPIKDEEPAEPWIEVVKRAAKPRQNTSKAAEKARARTYPRPMCEESAQVDYVYTPQHVPTRELFTSARWSVIEKTRDIPVTRNPVRLKDNPHKAILEYGIRRRFTDYKVCVLQVLESGKQTPPPGSPFTLDGPDTYWVQTTIQLNDDGTLPFAELPGMLPTLYTFDTFWEIPKRTDGQPLRGITLGVAQYVVGTFELEFKKKPETSKTFVDKEPFWLNPEAFRAARVLLKEVSSCYHQEDLGVMNWGHAFVYQPSQINFSRPHSGRWVHISALVEHLYSVKQEDFDYLPFHTRGFVRMVPKIHWAAMFILASIMDSELQVACDRYGFIWIRATVCDIKRPRPAFVETIDDPETGEQLRVKGDGNIDYTGEITSKPFGYVVCTVQEIHEAFDTRTNRGSIPTDTFISFTSRYPEISFQSNHVPRTPGLLIVKFDTWSAFRLGAMAYKTGMDQWMMTTGIPLESIVFVRDHVGSYFDPLTLDTMTWGFLPPRADEPVLLIDVETGVCKMPTTERWHCLMMKTERENSADMHLLDWRPYSKDSGDPYLSLRNTEQNPTDVSLTLSEWNGMKIWQIATMLPNQGETAAPRKWMNNQSGVNYLTDSVGRGEWIGQEHQLEMVRAKVVKERALAKRARNPLRLQVPQKVRMLSELEGDTSQAQQHSQKYGEKGSLRNLSCQDLLRQTQEGPPWPSSKAQMGFQSLEEHG